MRSSRSKSSIIGILLVLLLPWLAGCSALRLSYDNGAQLAWWWLDGYVDFDRAQTPAARQAVDRFFAWHRSTQLMDYAALLASAQAPVVEPVTPALVCQLYERMLKAAEPALDRAAAELADLVPALGEPQLRHIEQRFAKVIDEMRDDYLQADAKERFKGSVQRTVKQAERLYGRLEDAQRSVIEAGVQASPFDPQRWLVERQRRQRDTLQVLRRLLATRADHDTRVAALRTLVQRSLQASEPEYRAYQVRLTEYNCGLAARIHNAGTPAQRQQARETLKGWEDDLRALAAAPGP